jgi:hypothetical protein
MGPVLKFCLVLLAGFAAGYARAEFDPTAPPKIEAVKATGAPAESGLAWVRVEGKHSIAWYGGTTVKLGDRVEGGRVVAIREDHIVIAGREGRRTIPLLDPQVQHEPVAFPPPVKRK